MYHVLGGFDREAAMRVYRALGLAGSTRGVNKHERVFGGRMFGGRVVWLLGEQFVIPMVATQIEGNICAGAAQHDAVPDGRALLQCFIRNRFHVDRMPAPDRAIGRK